MTKRSPLNRNRWYLLNDGTLLKLLRHCRQNVRVPTCVVELKTVDGDLRREVWTEYDVSRRIRTAPDAADFRRWREAMIRRKINLHNLSPATSKSY